MDWETFFIALTATMGMIFIICGCIPTDVPYAGFARFLIGAVLFATAIGLGV